VVFYARLVMRLSKNFTANELCVSSTAARLGRPIVLEEQITSNLRALATETLQPVRDLLGIPVIINSGYRPEWLNKRIGGSANSQHMQGFAADFRLSSSSDLSLIDACKQIVSSDITYDQLILEHNEWIHISYSENPRYEVLTAFSERSIGISRTQYVKGLEQR